MLQRFVTNHLWRIAAVVAHSIMWAACGVVSAAASAESLTDEESIHISLPVFVSSIIATAVFTWAVAGRYNAQNTRIDRLQQQLQQALEQVGGSTEDDA